MAFFRIEAIVFIILIMFIESCGVHGPKGETFVYKSSGTIFNRFKPIISEKYKGDTLTVSNCLIANYRTGSYFKGVKILDINEDSVLKIAYLAFDKIGLNTNTSNEYFNLLNPDIFFDFNHSLLQRIERNIESKSSVNNDKGMCKLIPTFVFEKDHDASSFAGPGEVKVRYYVTFMVFIYNSKNELIYKNERSISAKPESIWEWEEALAFPIEDRVTGEHFEEMIMEALPDYVE